MTPDLIKDEEIIDKPGLYRMSIDWYHSDCCSGPSVSNTGLRRVEACPEKFWDAYPGNPDYEPVPETDAQRLGRMAHAWCIERRLPSDIIISPFDDFRTSEAKGWKAEAEAEGLTVYKQKELDAVYAMAKRLDREPLMQIAREGGLIECSLIWRDETTGLWLKSRPDVVPNDTILTDYKTTTDASPDEIKWTIRNYGYHCQLALMAEGMARVCRREMESFSLILQEKKRPFTVTISAVNERAVHWGARLNRFAIDRLARCFETGDWPGYAEGPVNSDLPESEIKRLEAHDSILPQVPSLGEMAAQPMETEHA